MEKFNEDDGVWRTIRGRRVFIREGESVESAMSRSGKFKGMSRVEKNKEKYDKINKFKERKQSNLKVKYHKTDTGIEANEEDRKRIMKELGYDKDNLSKNFEKKDNDKYEMKKEERDKVFKDLGIRNDNEEEPTPKRKDEKETSRRENLMRFTQENKEQIKKWADEYDEETNKRAFEKAKEGKGLTAKEYFGFLGSDMIPGSVIGEQFADGEDAVVAKDGNWVRASRVKAYNESPKANQDAIYDDKKESKLFWDKEDKENPLPTLEQLRSSYKDHKNPFRDDEATKKELEKEKINRFKEQKQSNIKTNNEKETYEKNYNNIMNWEKEGNNYNIKARGSVGGYGETTFVFSKQDNNRKDIAHYKITLDKLGKMSEKEIKDVLSNVEKKLR